MSPGLMHIDPVAEAAALRPTRACEPTLNGQRRRASACEGDTDLAQLSQSYECRQKDKNVTNTIQRWADDDEDCWADRL